MTMHWLLWHHPKSWLGVTQDTQLVQFVIAHLLEKHATLSTVTVLSLHMPKAIPLGSDVE